MSTDHIRYDLLAQDALRGVVKRVLADAARDGLPGDHHFYISFKTKHPGVKLSPRLGEKYPDEITIVLQHQFWDLTVTDQAFEVGLSFRNAPEKLVVPFDAISGFFDPSVQFGLKFEVATKDDDEIGEPAAAPPPRPALRGGASEPAEETPDTLRAAKASPKTGERKKTSAKPLTIVPASEGGQAGGDKPQKVISLDTFRKKT
jgi:hypothetical protein